MSRKNTEPITVDIDDPDMMNWINEMRNSQPSAEERRKISDWRYYHRNKDKRAVANLKWRTEHAEQYEQKQKEYHSRQTVLEKKRENSRIRYHTDPEWREALLARQRKRYHAMTPEQKAEYARKQSERARKRRAKAKEAKEAKETK